jgi:uncharacterized tellurite resistance protein B-like protein
MANEMLVLTLAKVVAAAAWVDGEVEQNEIYSLKDLLFRLDDMSARDWAEIDIYLDSPVGDEERERLIADLQEQVRSAEDRELVHSTLEQLVEADGSITDEEQMVLEEIDEAIQSGAAGAFQSLSGLLRSPLNKRNDAVASAPNREEYLDDFIANKIYYEVMQNQDLGVMDLSLSDQEKRRLSLAGGLLARIAYVDKQISPEEREYMVQVIREQWDLEQEAAVLVTEIALSEIGTGMDYFRLTRGFFDLTSQSERERFVAALFRIASIDGDPSFDEVEEIRIIANGLKLTHKQFIDAKLEGTKAVQA